jgi:hypothetical protein
MQFRTGGGLEESRECSRHVRFAENCCQFFDMLRHCTVIFVYQACLELDTLA